MLLATTIALGAGLVLSGPDSSGAYHLDVSHLEINSGCLACDADLFSTTAYAKPNPFARPATCTVCVQRRPVSRPVITKSVHVKG